MGLLPNLWNGTTTRRVLVLFCIFDLATAVQLQTFVEMEVPQCQGHTFVRVLAVVLVLVLVQVLVRGFRQ
jgi:hypothetical protein